MRKYIAPNINEFKKIVIVFILLPFIAGCASILTRTNDDYKSAEPGPYLAVRTDVETISSLSRKDYDPLLTGAEPIVFIASLVDIPLAVALDTIFLPYDLIRSHGYLQKIRNLTNKYFPGYMISKNSNTGENKGSVFYLIPPSGTEIDLLNSRKFENNEIIYPELDIILQEQDISISSSNEAREIVELIDSLMYGRVLTGNWRYDVSHKERLWTVKIIDKKTGRTQLGHTCLLEADSNNFLRKIRSRTIP